MKFSSRAQKIITQISTSDTRLGDLRLIAKEIKKDHALALELWSSGKYFARQLAILIMDKKIISKELVDEMISDISKHSEDENLQLIDWLMANQLSKEKKTIALMESWENSADPLKRRTFWYYQGRLRWVGQSPPPNTDALLKSIEKKLASEVPAVQWAMNFTAAQIGIFQQKYRKRCMDLGKKVGLYKNDFVAKGCTPNYLPELISIQVEKLKK